MTLTLKVNADQQESALNLGRLTPALLKTVLTQLAIVYLTTVLCGFS